MSRPPASAGLPALVTSAWPARVALAFLLAALGAFLAWQYAMPAGFESSFLLDHVGLAHFRDALGLPGVTMSVSSYRTGFRLLLAAMWIAYFALLLAGAAGGALPGRRAVAFVVAGVALVAAAAWPPSFSCDVYGYVGYGRMKVLYGLNPYATSQKWLIDHHDATGPFLLWSIPSPYGPLWTALSAASVWVLRGASLYVQVVAMKLVGAAALVACAWGGRRVAERLAPGRGDLTMLAIGANPLFVIEAAGNAHNDFVMMALVVAAIGALLDGRTVLAATLAGVGAAIKFLPLMLVPWIVLAARRPQPRDLPRLMRDGLVCAVAALAPLVLSYWPFWIGKSVFLGLRQRSSSGQVTSPADAVVMLVVYAAATVWLLRDAPNRVVGAWIAVAVAIFMLATGMWLPWYLSWFWIPALMRWDRRSLIATALTFCFAIVLTLQYSVPSGG